MKMAPHSGGMAVVVGTTHWQSGRLSWRRTQADTPIEVELLLAVCPFELNGNVRFLDSAALALTAHLTSKT